MVFEQVNQILQEVEAFGIGNKEELEQFRLRFMARKGVIPELMEQIKNVPAEQRKAYGMAVNQVKETAQAKFKERQEALESKSFSNQPVEDLTLPPIPNTMGTRHPLSGAAGDRAHL